MSEPYLTGQALLTECAAGRGVIVMVEGETKQDDAWFFGRWFYDLATRVSFFAQNGWPRVRDAVYDLRAQLPDRSVFGIIDGDFGDHDALGDGVFRLPRFALENFLLDPGGWSRVANKIQRGPLPRWESEDAASERIADAYRRCGPVAAWNRVARDEWRRAPLPPKVPFRKHGAALDGVDVQAELTQWTNQRQAPHSLHDAFAQHSNRLAAADLETWQREVHGKHVLGALVHALNAALKRQIQLDVLCTMYLDEVPAPPAEVRAVVDHILTLGQPGGG